MPPPRRAADYKFALNNQLEFFTPEKLFLGSTNLRDTLSSGWELGFDPRTLPRPAARAPVAEGADAAGEAEAGEEEEEEEEAKTSAAAAMSSDRPLFPDLGPDDQAAEKRDGQELVVLVGAPGVGKSKFCATHLPSYERVNQDTLKTVAKFVAVGESTAQTRAGLASPPASTHPPCQVRQGCNRSS